MKNKVIFFALIISSPLVASEALSKQKKENEKELVESLPNKLEGFSIAKAFMNDLWKTTPNNDEVAWRETHLPQLLHSATRATTEPTPTAKQQRPHLPSKL